VASFLDVSCYLYCRAEILDGGTIHFFMYLDSWDP